MSDDEILFDDIYELHEVIGEHSNPYQSCRELENRSCSC